MIFFSFAVISFIGLVLATFPLLNQLGAGLVPASQHETRSAPARQTMDTPPDNHIAAITAVLVSLSEGKGHSGAISVAMGSPR